MAPQSPMGQQALAVSFAEDAIDPNAVISRIPQTSIDSVLQNGQPRIVSKRGADDRFPEEKSLFDQGFQSCAFLPLLCSGEPIGVLAVAFRDAASVGPESMRALTDIADVMALALDRRAAYFRIAELEHYQSTSTFLRDEIKAERDLRPLTGDSAAMKAVRLAVQQVARTDSTVLILGETGTGKELVARAIHQLSPRRDRLLVAVNCAALAPGIIASELFGHEAGAYTGAVRRRQGRFEVADGGTIFLDEIGELPAEMQVLLLRVLQERNLERVGGHDPIPIDVRVIVATHRDLAALMKQDRFRADLFFRLNVFPIRVPPLRDRREDIPGLARHFLLQFNRRLNRHVREISPASLQLLSAYHWPGNVRELENLIERAVIVAEGDTLAIDPNWLCTGQENEHSTGLASLERQAIVEALQKCGGRIYGPTGAAALLGIKPTTLYGKMRKHDVRKGTV